MMSTHVFIIYFKEGTYFKSDIFIITIADRFQIRNHYNCGVCVCVHACERRCKSFQHRHLNKIGGGVNGSVDNV